MKKLFILWPAIILLALSAGSAGATEMQANGSRHHPSIYRHSGWLNDLGPHKEAGAVLATVWRAIMQNAPSEALGEKRLNIGRINVKTHLHAGLDVLIKPLALRPSLAIMRGFHPAKLNAEDLNHRSAGIGNTDRQPGKIGQLAYHPRDFGSSQSPFHGMVAASMGSGVPHAVKRCEQPGDAANSTEVTDPVLIHTYLLTALILFASTVNLIWLVIKNVRTSLFYDRKVEERLEEHRNEWKARILDREQRLFEKERELFGFTPQTPVERQ